MAAPLWRQKQQTWREQQNDTLPPKGAPYSRVMRVSLREAGKLKHRLDHIGPQGTRADSRYGKTWRLGR